MLKDHIRGILRVEQCLKLRGLRLFGKKGFDEYMRLLCEAKWSTDEKYMTYTLFPGKADQLTVEPACSIPTPESAIILQGPVAERDDYTIETIGFYRMLNPASPIIVSTWENTPRKLCERIEAAGAHVVLSEPPSTTGVGNINYQAKSTTAGLIEAKKLGLRRALKTRTDQRLLRTNLIGFLDVLLDKFPLGDVYPHLTQHERIVFGQGNTGGAMFVPFFLCDFYMYGHIDDLIAYFDFPVTGYDCSKAEREALYRDLKYGHTMLEYRTALSPEILFTRNYVTNKGSVKIPNTVEESWKFIRECAICLSHEDVDLHWQKYRSWLCGNAEHRNYAEDDNEKCLKSYNWTFQNWLCLYAGILPYSAACEAPANHPATVLLQ